MLINHVDEKSFALGHDTNCEFHERFGGGNNITTVLKYTAGSVLPE